MRTVRKVESRAKTSRLGEIAGRFKSWKPAREVLTRVRAVPTIFPQLDRATMVGGWPIERFGLIHGPSNMGKTTLLHGLGLSFLQRGHWYAYVDAEYTTPEDWLGKLMAEHASNHGFVAMRPKTYEQTVGAVREFVEGIGEAREKGELAPETTALVAIDSIRKLVPDRLLEKVAKGEGGVDGASGRAAMMRAALNAQWLDELTPLLYHTRTALVFVARESENPSTDPWAPEFKVGGGRALVYDSSLVCRVTRDSWVKEGTGKDAKVLGERHRIRITKTKVGGKEDKHTDCYFHTSNGVASPVGFDTVRDLFELGVELGVIEKAGPWFSFEGARLGQGENAACAALRKDAAMVTTISERVRRGEGEVGA